jgi:nucleoside-diphosphate-sugar epimerase
MNLRSLVTSASCFIGLHLAERLVPESYEVVGVYCFTDYYPRPVKEQQMTGR